LDQKGQYAANLHLSGAVNGTLIVSGAINAGLLWAGRSDYPAMHTILDTAILLLSCVLALFLWDIGWRLEQGFPRWVAASFAVASLMEALHMAVTIDWFGRLAPISHAASLLRPATWAPAAYVLPVGIGISLWRMQRSSKAGAHSLGLALLVLSVGLVAAFVWLPRYTPPTWLGITRPTLIPVPLLWGIVGAFCLRLRRRDRILPALALTALPLALAHTAMLYSRAPHDTAAMVAHFGSAAGRMVLLLSAMQIASSDMHERQRGEAKFRGLLESAPDAIVVVTATGRMALVNSQAEILFGHKREEMIGREIELLIPARFRHAHPAHVTGFFASSHARAMGKGLDLYGLRRDGSEFPVEISLSPLETEEGILVSAAIRDVTSRKQSENEIRRLNQSLEERAEELAASNKELEAFTYTAAHDLRAPLRHLHGYSTFLKEAWYERLDEEGRHFLDRIMISTKGMAVLLDELLNFSRLGRVELQTHSVSLADLVARIREGFESEPDAQRVTWEVGELPTVEGDLSLLHQVLVNLLSNAVKYSRKSAEPKVIIDTVSAEAGMITLRVQDNGAGFDMQYASKLFQVFQRLHRAKDFEGTGIGLAIVRRIVERHGGRVWAEGTVGQGATFYFSLPNRRQNLGQTRVHSAGR
jgi:PAS domain S-box-containing protein